MKHQDAERITTEYLKPIFGFALKRCQNTEDAEDLSQEIVLKAFRALLSKDDIADVGKFIWTIAHNALSNYYRENGKSMVCVSVDEVAEVLADNKVEKANIRVIDRGALECVIRARVETAILRGRGES